MAIMDPETQSLIAHLPLTPHGQALLTYVRTVRDEIDRDTTENPTIDPGAGKQHVLYRLGSKSRLDWLLNLPMQAAEDLNK